MFQHSVDYFGGAVAGVGVVEEREDVCAAAVQGAAKGFVLPQDQLGTVP